MSTHSSSASSRAPSSSAGSNSRLTTTSTSSADRILKRPSASPLPSHSLYRKHPTLVHDPHQRSDPFAVLGSFKRYRTSFPLPTSGRASNATALFGGTLCLHAPSSSSRSSTSAHRPRAPAPPTRPPSANLHRPPRSFQPRHAPRTSLQSDRYRQTPTPVISLVNTDSDWEPAPENSRQRPRTPSRRSRHLLTGRRRQGPLEIEVIDLCLSDDDSRHRDCATRKSRAPRTIEVIVVSDSDSDHDSDGDVEIVSEKGPDPTIVHRREKLRAIKLGDGLAADADSGSLGSRDSLRSTDLPPPRPASPRSAPAPTPANKPAAPELPPVQPVMVNGKEKWAVSEIVDSKLVWTTKKRNTKLTTIKRANKKERSIMYLVEWVGFAGEPTWEPVQHLENCRELIDQFHLENPGKPKL